MPNKNKKMKLRGLTPMTSFHNKISWSETPHQKATTHPRVYTHGFLVGWVSGLIIIFFLMNCLVIPQARAQEEGSQIDIDEQKTSIEELQTQIRAKSSQIDEINDKISTYEQQVDSLKGQAVTLKGHINILDSQINRSENEINLLNNQIQQIELEIKKINLDIKVAQEEMDIKLDEMQIILQEINSLDEEYLGSMEQESRGSIDLVVQFFKIIIKYASWSDYEKTMEDTKTINEVLKQKRDELSDLKQSLEADKKEAENKARELVDKQNQLESRKEFLAEEKNSKKMILAETQDNESKYEALLEKAAAAQRALNREVITLQEEVKKKIAQLQQGARNITNILTWPIQYRRITAIFHDPTYPYRKYFEHNAVDISCTQGTPIHAPAAGYVASARDAGYGYNYITLIHTETLQTRYGHVSAFAVKAGEFVQAGQVIGYTGGTPGTPGAGYLTTGPHLHLEVRIGTNTIDQITGEAYTVWESVNPLNYLP